MENDFQNTSVKGSKPNNYTAKIDPKADKVVGEVSKDKKSKASKANMPDVMWEQYVKCPEHRNGCYKEECIHESDNGADRHTDISTHRIQGHKISLRKRNTIPPVYQYISSM